MWPEDLIIQVSNQRDHTICYMNLDLMKFEIDKVTIFVTELLKQTQPGHHLEPMVLMRYSDTDICALSHLQKYREVTKNIKKSNKLLLGFMKPHKPISTSPLSRWCVSTLQQAGFDITVFGSHSTWSASTSHCQRKGLSIKQINKVAEQSSVQPFARFYRKRIEEEHFSKVILEV